jgi:integrase
MISLQALTGARPGEVCRITTGQLDRTCDPWVYRPTEHKTKGHGKDRAIPLGPQAQALLGPWLKADPDAPLFSPRESRAHFDANRPHGANSTEKRREQWRCYWRKGHKRSSTPHEKERYSVRSYYNSVQKACKRAGVPPFGLNRIRHSFATKVRRAFGLEASQVMLGHSHADVTQIYGERDLTKAVEIAKKIARGASLCP